MERCVGNCNERQVDFGMTMNEFFFYISIYNPPWKDYIEKIIYRIKF